jgi:peptide-methionine (S)-S-oxide reductase
MTVSSAPRRQLPARPSQEHLRKSAKRLAREEALPLAAAQRKLAGEYGYRSWAALMRAVEAILPPAAVKRSPLAEAAAQADEATVRALLGRGEHADGAAGEPDTPLFLACDSEAPAAPRIAVASLLLDAGASPRETGRNQMTPLHAAARRGPLALVELLIRNGALGWQPDRRGKTALDYARKGEASDRAAIAELLDTPVIRDKRFRAAVAAIHDGDVEGLGRLLDQHPDLLTMRAIEPDCYREGYFRNPKLFWFIANNPTLMKKVPENIADIAQALIARGVETADLNYALELVMSAGGAMPAEKQAALIPLLLDAGATATADSIAMALAHRCVAPIEALLSRGHGMTVAIAASLDRRAELASLLPGASAEERQAGLGLAVINRHREAALLCLEAGADPNQFLPVHRHSLPLHQAALDDDVAMLRLLVEHGARLDIKDTLWRSTPLGWAVHTGKAAAEAYLRALVEAAG